VADRADPPGFAGRARWLRPDQLNEAQRRVYDTITSGPRAGTAGGLALTDDQGRLYGPFNAMLLSPAVGEALQALGVVLRYRSQLSDRAREIAVLEVARRTESEFEWYAHTRLATAAGLDAAEIEAVQAGVPLRLPPAEAVVREVAVALLRDGDLGDELFAAAQAELGSALLAELITLVGYYELLATSMRVWRTPLPAGVAEVFTAT
jgi:4-carboxymuconolactone decarboxylase